MAVAELGREAGRIAGDGRLTGQIEAAAGHRAGVDGKAKLSRTRTRTAAVHRSQAERDADGTALAGYRACSWPTAPACRRTGSRLLSALLPVTGLSQRLPEMYLRPSAKVLTVSWQWLPQPPHFTLTTFCSKALQLLLAHHAGGRWCRPCCSGADHTVPHRKHPSGPQCPGG